jgi:uncharacterized membrane protein
LSFYLQTKKAPWVDECYTYYGVWHGNFSEFYDSILTGINYSPPLYFLFNFCLQLIFPTSIEQLRIQSLFFIIIGIVLSFLLSRKIFGTTTAFIATILVSSQSSLFLYQSQEARHYAMFFACGAWVLYMQFFHNVDTQKNKWFTFFAHFCLCQVHYLGIIFSGLSGTVYFFTSIKKGLWGRIPIPIVLCWFTSIFLYLFYLTNQKSVLNTWPKPNELSDLLAGYNDSLLILTILIPICIIILTKESKGNTKPTLIKETHFLRPINITSILWFSVPIFFWILSHLTSLNLFVDRYFIPKEAALILLVAYGFNFISRKLPQQKTLYVPILCTLTLSIILFLISAKRAAFGLNKDTNYHHSLLVEESYPTSKQPIILEGDPKYFPNAYLGKYDCLFAMENKSLIGIYNRFSNKIKFSDQ